MKILFVAVVAVILGAGVAQAAVPVPVMKVMGADFYMRCTNPPTNQGAQVVSVCAAYVAGIADDLMDARKVCLPPQVTPARLLPFALNWMRTHSQNGSLPAVLQVRTGLATVFPCKPITKTAQNQQVSLGDALSLGKQFYELWTAAKPLIAMLLH